MRESADKKLANRLLRGDSRSFEVFFNGYFPRIYRFALVRLDHDHNLAEDAAQTVMCQALSKMSTYRGEAPLFSWLCTFCRHEISRQRRLHGYPHGGKLLRDDAPGVRAALDSLLSETGNDPDITAYRSELRQLVKVALDQLPSLYADTLECKYVLDISVREIANRLGKSEKAAESILTRARVAFRECFRSLLDNQQDYPFDTRQVSAAPEQSS